MSSQKVVLTIQCLDLDLEARLMHQLHLAEKTGRGSDAWTPSEAREHRAVTSRVWLIGVPRQSDGRRGVRCNRRDVMRAQTDPVQSTTARVAFERMVGRAKLVAEHEGHTMRVVVGEAEGGDLECAHHAVDQRARREVREAARGDEHARQLRRELIVHQTPEDGVLLDNENAASWTLAICNESERADGCGVAGHLEDCRCERLRCGLGISGQQIDATCHAASRRGDDAERFPRHRHTATFGDGGTDVHDALIHLRRPREEAIRLESVPELSLRDLATGYQRLVHRGKNGP